MISIRIYTIILLVRLNEGEIMSTFATTKLSSKGQVVIPEDIRNALGLEPGVSLLVMGENDVVILKVIKQPSMKDFGSLVETAHKIAKEVGLSKDDVKSAIKEARKKK